MEKEYDVVTAGQALEAMARARADNPHAGIQLSQMCTSDNWEADYAVVETDNTKVMRLVKKVAPPASTSDNPTDHVENVDSAACSELEEIVMSVQGIVMTRDELPPFTDKMGSNSHGLRFIRQGLAITGMDTPTFKAATDNIAKLYALFSRHILQNKLQNCTTVSIIGEHTTITSSNRYFTAKRADTQELEFRFSTDIDPNGTLSKLAGKGYFHGEENVVHYYERVTNRLGGHKYLPMPPVKIKVGDIVEVQMSMIIIPLRGGEFKMSSLLRSVTLMDGKYTELTDKEQNATIEKLGKQVVREGPKKMKRKIGYVDEEIGETRAKLSRMDIDQGK